MIFWTFWTVSNDPGEQMGGTYKYEFLSWCPPDCSLRSIGNELVFDYHAESLPDPGSYWPAATESLLDLDLFTEKQLAEFLLVVCLGFQPVRVARIFDVHRGTIMRDVKLVQMCLASVNKLVFNTSESGERL